MLNSSTFLGFLKECMLGTLLVFWIFLCWIREFCSFLWVFLISVEGFLVLVVRVLSDCSLF